MLKLRSGSGWLLMFTLRPGRLVFKDGMSISQSVHQLHTNTLRMLRNTAFSKKVVRNKAAKCTQQDRKLVWVFTGILHIGLEEMYKFVFLHVKNLFFLSGGLYL